MSGVRVTLKLATSLDARIALADGTSQWITSSESRARGHQLRASHDAILVGIGTVLADDPLLTARTVPLPKKQPVRIVADSNGRTPLSSRLVQSVSSGASWWRPMASRRIS
jgi:diaminohydroxyphosphoribosylaminopyrimidine deaminase/5-amino-6-(5-phosphoribosylamino)uracil reductase